jgi:hypothetical protein
VVVDAEIVVVMSEDNQKGQANEDEAADNAVGYPFLFLLLLPRLAT